jgi:hypothetical protein
MVRCLVAWGLRLQLMGCEMRVMRGGVLESLLMVEKKKGEAESGRRRSLSSHRKQYFTIEGLSRLHATFYVRTHLYGSNRISWLIPSAWFALSPV